MSEVIEMRTTDSNLGPDYSRLKDSLRADFDRAHFAFVRAPLMREWLGHPENTREWIAFCDSWDGLPEDGFMADGGRYRQRRYAAFGMQGDDPIQRKAPQPHYQSRDRNPLNGGIERWFEPVLPEVADGECMRAIFGSCRSWLAETRPEVSAWHTEMHQFRILADAASPGKPTPEGMHRDGVDFVLVLLIRRVNVREGTTTIANLDKRVVGEFTLAEPLDAAMVDDRLGFHGVTAIAPLDPTLPAYRDVLVVTWRAESAP